MGRVILAFLFLFDGAAAQAQTGWEYLDDSPERLIGLLDLDDIVRDGCGPAPQRATARVFARPSDTSSAVGTLSWLEEADRFCGLMFEGPNGSKEKLPTLESGYEIPAAIVYERRSEWFRIRLVKGSAWVRQTDSTAFLRYPDMLREHLAHTLQTWDGTLRATPGAFGKVTPLSDGWKALLDRQLSVDYLGSRRVGGELWVQIRLTSEGACGQKRDGVETVSGWIPAYQPDRSPSLWFASRGC